MHLAIVMYSRTPWGLIKPAQFQWPSPHVQSLALQWEPSIMPGSLLVIREHQKRRNGDNFSSNPPNRSYRQQLNEQ